MYKVFSAVTPAVKSKGFWKTVFYSFGSWFAVWAIVWLASPEAVTSLGRFGWMIPLFNTIWVFLKQYCDAYSAAKKVEK